MVGPPGDRRGRRVALPVRSGAGLPRRHPDRLCHRPVRPAVPVVRRPRTVVDRLVVGPGVAGVGRGEGPPGRGRTVHMNPLSLPWLEFAILLPIVGALGVSRLRRPNSAALWCAGFAAAAFGCAALAWLGFY